MQCGHTWIAASFLPHPFFIFIFFIWPLYSAASTFLREGGSLFLPPSLPFSFSFVFLFLFVKLSHKDFSLPPKSSFLLTFPTHLTTNKPLNDPSTGLPTAGVRGPPRPTALPLSVRVPGPARGREHSRGHGGDCGPAALGEPPPPCGPQRAAPGHAPPGPRPLVHGPGSVPPDGRGGRTF